MDTLTQVPIHKILILKGQLINREMAANDRAVEHCRHIANKAGIEALALGSDVDGIESTGEMVDFRNMPVLLDRMNKFFTMDEIGKISSGNVLRVVKDVLQG